MLSAFLPAGFDPSRPVALIAGQSDYPRLIGAGILAAGVPLRLIVLEGETSPDLVAMVPPSDRLSIKVGQVGHMLKALKKLGAQYALMAGQITPRRLFHGLHPDLKATRILMSLKLRNAETIFGAVTSEIEALGITMLDARAFIDDHLSHLGSMVDAKHTPAPEHLEHGIHIAREIARLDIGQGCVVRKGTVLAVEGFEGTDAMITRAGEFKTDLAIFVKTVKRNQDYRFDVPCFGLKTLETLNHADIRVAALEADRVIMVNKPEVLARAREWKIDLLGYR